MTSGERGCDSEFMQRVCGCGVVGTEDRAFALTGGGRVCDGVGFRIAGSMSVQLAKCR